MNIAQIHEEATEAAQKAAADCLAAMGGDRDACGFAWVTVRDIKLSTKVGKEFAALGFRKGYGQGAGIELWNPSGSPVQSITVKEQGAYAYAGVFRKYGYNAYTSSRLD